MPTFSVRPSRFSEHRILGDECSPQSGESHLLLAHMDLAKLPQSTEPLSKIRNQSPQMRSSP